MVDDFACDDVEVKHIVSVVNVGDAEVGFQIRVFVKVVLTEKLWGTGSGASSLTNLENAINEQCAKGYRLHTISTASSGSKGWLGGDKIQATMVFESLKLGK